MDARTLALSTLNGQYVGTPAFFNFCRPSGPNPAVAEAILATEGAAGAACVGLRTGCRIG